LNTNVIFPPTPTPTPSPEPTIVAILTEEENRKRILNEHSIDLNSPFDLSDFSMTPSMFLESQKSIDANGFVIPKNSVTDSKID
jgi:hypothetical protein